MKKQWNLRVGRVQTNCFIVADAETGEAVVIDPGDSAERILSVIKVNNLNVKYIFLTHGHFDHIMAVSAVKAATGALVVIHEADAARLTDGRQALAPVLRRGELTAGADITVRGGESFDVGNLRFEWLHTPGHTPGSCVIICGDALYTGDTLFEGDCGRCDLPGGDYGKILASLRLIAALPGDYEVFPGHDVFTTLERERCGNGSMLEAMRAK